MRYISYTLLFFFSIACGSKTAENESKPAPEDVKVKETELTSSEGLKMDEIVLPEGFKIAVFARVNNARSLAFAPDGTLFVSNRNGDKIYAIQDTDKDWKADKRYVIREGLKMPNGIAFKDGD
ncbi:MAG: sorbosone dehydrogenase family protein, partial [Bacteroidota bacterium]